MEIDETVAFLRKKCGPFQSPQMGIVCGSGLGGLSGRLKDSISIVYEQIPHFPTSTVSGHLGQLTFGYLAGVACVCMSGRFHYYEGYDLKQVTFPIRVLAKLGIKTLLVTNAAGGVDPALQVGDVMAIEDHISFLNLAGLSPLRGANLDNFGPRFPAMTRIYHPKTRDLLEEAAELAGFSDSNFIRSGVYCAVGGPSYETPAEIRLLRLVGGSAVGMSTVPEVVVAVHSGIERILAFSLITNRCIGDAREDTLAPTHAEVLETSKMRVEQLEAIVEQLISLLF
jgi:purine-nucleoside phosphorylase